MSAIQPKFNILSSSCKHRYFYGRCSEGIGRHNVKMSVYVPLCHVAFLKHLIGQKRECYIVKEVIEVDKHNKGNLKSAETGKQTVHNFYSTN